MAVFKLSLCSLWTILIIILLLTVDECQGQSTSGGINIVAVIIAVVVIVLLVCLLVPICIICLVVALACTCVKYRKTKQSVQTVDSRTEYLPPPPYPGRTAIHQLPLPPIPTDVDESTAQEYEIPNGASEIMTETNQAYGSNPTTTANRAYDSNLITDANKAYESNLTEVDQAYELDDIMKIDTNTAHKSDLKIGVNRAYGSILSAEAISEATGASQPITDGPIPVDKNVAYGHNQLSEESGAYEYI